jgi:chromosome segregation ATPase
MSLQGERETLKGDVEGVQTQLKLMCDYREVKDGQVSYANERYDKAKEYVTQHERERETLQKMVTEKDTRLEGLRKKLTEANRSLRAKNDLVVESERQATQLTVDKERLSEEVQTLKTQIMQSEGELRSESMTRMDTLNGNIVQVLGSLEVYSKENTELIAKAKHMEGSVIPRLKEEVVQAQAQLSETQKQSSSVIKDYEVSIQELQGQVGDLERQLTIKEKALSEPRLDGILIMSGPEDRAALEICKSEHSDFTALQQRLAECESANSELKAKYRDAVSNSDRGPTKLESVIEKLDLAREEIRGLYEKQVVPDVQTSNVSDREPRQGEVETQDAEQQNRIKTLDGRGEDLRRQEYTIHLLNVQLSEYRREADVVQSLNTRLQGTVSALSIDKRDLTQKVSTVTAERDAALKARTDAYRERDAVTEAVKHASEENKIATKELIDLKAERNRLMKQLVAAYGRAEGATQQLIEERNRSSNPPKGPEHPVSQERIVPLQHELDSVQDEMLDNADAEVTHAARSTDRIAMNRNPHNSINVPEQAATSEDMANITHRSRSQAPFSRKRVANDQLHDDREQWRPYRVAQSVEGATGRRIASDNDGTATPEQQAGRVSAGAPITNPPDPQRYIYPIDDAWDENFGDGRIPATVINKLRSQMKAWSKKKPNWTGSDRRRCANSFASRKPGDREDMHGCDACAEKSLICVAVYQKPIELLPLKDAGQVSISGEGHWFRRKMD